MATRDVGAMGEDQFAVWCSQVGITANPVRRDRTGKDFQVEFPLPHASSQGRRPLDREVKPIRGWVQVKASDQRKRSIPVKLDNWVRLAIETVPAFFLVMEYDNRSYPQRAFLIHVGEEHRDLPAKGRVRTSQADEPGLQADLVAAVV